MRVEINRTFDQLRGIQAARYFVLYGGRRSGKSVGTSQLLDRRARECAPRKIGVLRKFGTTIRFSTWPRMLAAVDEAVGLSRCTIRRVDREIHLPGGSQILFLGADDREKLKSAEEFTDFWLEEASEFDEADLDTLDAGLSARCDPPPSIWLTFNPIPVIQGAQHWLQRRFLQVEHEMDVPAVRGDVVVLRTWYQSNHFCPPATVRLLEGYEASNPDLFKMWALGEFTSLRGAILKNWDTAKEVPSWARFLGYGMDFGFAEDPAAVVGVWRSDNELWIREYVYASDLTDPELSEAMIEAGIRKGVDDIVADSASPKSITELKKLGWVVEPCQKKGPDYKRTAAQFLRGLLIHVTEDSPNVQREIASWSWKQDKEGKSLPVVADGNDHTIDATIYRAFKPVGSLFDEDIASSRSSVGALRSGSVIDPRVPALGGV